MKTTLELPDALLRRAKVAAAQMDTTLKALIQRALERELTAPGSQPGKDTEPTYVLDEDGMPCLPHRGAVVTDTLVSQLREEQGI